MTDKKWLLNHAAIKSARTCINLIQEELGIKLTLSHPDFLDMVTAYAELTESVELQSAFSELSNFVNVNQNEQSTKKTVSFLPTKQNVAVKQEVEQETHYQPSVEKSSAVSTTIVADDEVLYHGKIYKKYQDGLEFKGLYRGQPRYS